MGGGVPLAGEMGRWWGSPLSRRDGEVVGQEWSGLHDVVCYSVSCNVIPFKVEWSLPLPF